MCKYMKKIILANAPINNGNRGCVALSVTMMLLIDEVMREAKQDYKLYLSDSYFSYNACRQYRLKDKILTYETCNYPIGISLKDSIRIFINSVFFRKGNSKEIFKNADYILDIGQGDSFSDIYGKNRFLTIDRIHVLARKYSKPYCILPQTIGPFEDTSIAKKAHESIAKASVCMGRDQKSLDYVKSHVPAQKNVKEYIDVAFFMPYEKIEQDAKYIHVGINVSALLWNGGYTHDNQFGLECSYQKTVQAIIDYFLSLPNTKVHLIPHVVGSERGIENDYEVSYELWKKYKNPNLILAPFALGPVEIKSYIAGMDFFMGARMHATIGAFSSGVPVVPMAYSRKFNGLFVDTLQYDAMVDMKEQDDDKILSVIKNAFSRRVEFKSIIKDRMEGVVSERRRLLKDDLTKYFNLDK